MNNLESAPQKPKFLDQVRDVIQMRHDSRRLNWIIVVSVTGPERRSDEPRWRRALRQTKGALPLSESEIGDRRREFGYAVLPSHWNHGYTTEALSEVLSFAFCQRDANTIYGECNSLNVASARVMQKCGMKLVKRWTERHENQPDHDAERYLIERSEWKLQNRPVLGWDED